MKTIKQSPAKEEYGKLAKATKGELKSLIYLATNEMIEWNNFLVAAKKELKKRK